MLVVIIGVGSVAIVIVDTISSLLLFIAVAVVAITVVTGVVITGVAAASLCCSYYRVCCS